MVESLHPSVVVAGGSWLTLLADPSYFYGDVAQPNWKECPSGIGTLSAFLDVPTVVSASLASNSPSCLARTGGDVASYCTGAPLVATVTMSMSVLFSDGHAEEQAAPAALVEWHDSANRTLVAPTGASGVFELRVVGNCTLTHGMGRRGFR